MANYIYPAGARTFGARDALPAGAQDKVVKGAQLDSEFVELTSRSADKLDKDAQTGDFTGLIDGGTVSGGTF